MIVPEATAEAVLVMALGASPAQIVDVTAPIVPAVLIKFSIRVMEATVVQPSIEVTST